MAVCVYLCLLVAEVHNPHDTPQRALLRLTQRASIRGEGSFDANLIGRHVKTALKVLHEVLPPRGDINIVRYRDVLRVPVHIDVAAPAGLLVVVSAVHHLRERNEVIMPPELFPQLEKEPRVWAVKGINGHLRKELAFRHASGW
jgi:hypothetical protein